MTIVGLDPTGARDESSGAPAERQLAARPSSLAGARLGLVCNGLGMGEDLFDAIAAELCRTDGVAEVMKVRKGSVSIAPDPDDWLRLTAAGVGATVAITGFGG